MSSTHLAASVRIAARLGHFWSVEVPCPLGCGRRVTIIRRKRRVLDAADDAIRVHYKYDCPELHGY